MGKRFHEYDWDEYTDDILPEDDSDVISMKRTEEGSDEDFIWASEIGGFWIFDTWDSYDLYRAYTEEGADDCIDISNF